MAIYIATNDMCHGYPSYADKLLPADWKGKAFHLPEETGPRHAVLCDWEEATNSGWYISQVLIDSIKGNYTPLPGEITEKLQAQAERIKELGGKDEEMAAFKKKVAETAMLYAKDHGWCRVVKEALETMDITLPKKKYTFEVTRVFRVTGETDDFYSGVPAAYQISRALNDLETPAFSVENWDDLDIETRSTNVTAVRELDESGLPITPEDDLPF